MVSSSNFALFKGASHRAHFELAIFLWREWASSGLSIPADGQSISADELHNEIVSSLERCLQLHPSHVDAMKALALFLSDIKRDKDAAASVLNKLAEVHDLAAACRVLARCC